MSKILWCICCHLELPTVKRSGVLPVCFHNALPHAIEWLWNKIGGWKPHAAWEATSSFCSNLSVQRHAKDAGPRKRGSGKQSQKRLHWLTCVVMKRAHCLTIQHFASMLLRSCSWAFQVCTMSRWHAWTWLTDFSYRSLGWYFSEVKVLNIGWVGKTLICQM